MENSHIEWTDHTFNPWIGCTKVSPGCAHCYAETLMDIRYHRVKWGSGNLRIRTSEDYWRQPLRWNRAAMDRMDGMEPSKRPRVFCASLADWLDHEVPTAWRVDLLNLIESTPNLDWLLLTKRPESWSARLHETLYGSPMAQRWLDGEAPANVWMGVSAENQEWWDQRVPLLLSIPAARRFVSVEPMLGPVSFNWISMHRIGAIWDDGDLNPLTGVVSVDIAYPTRTGGPKIDWVIFGGESGDSRRPFDARWIENGVRRCREAGVPAFVKQDSAKKSGEQGRIPDELWKVKEWPQ